MHLSILWNRHFRLLESPADFAAAVNEYLAASLPLLRQCAVLSMPVHERFGGEIIDVFKRYQASGRYNSCRSALLRMKTSIF